MQKKLELNVSELLLAYDRAIALYKDHPILRDTRDGACVTKCFIEALQEQAKKKGQVICMIEEALETKQ